MGSGAISAAGSTEAGRRQAAVLLHESDRKWRDKIKSYCG